MTGSLVIVSAVPNDPQPTKTIDHVESFMITSSPYEMRVFFHDGSRMTINMNHVFAYAHIEEEGK